MGEYYDWVNLDKKQYLVPMEFEHGSKMYESCFYHDAIMGALHSLLSREWKGDHIAFIGDEAEIPEHPQNGTLKLLRKMCLAEGKYKGVYSTIREDCVSISGWFKAAETEVRKEIQIILDEPDHFLNIYGIQPEDPYRGLFEREPEFFRYTINHDKKEYYDMERTCWRQWGKNAPATLFSGLRKKDWSGRPCRPLAGRPDRGLE